jgi:hypothetical protein
MSGKYINGPFVVPSKDSQYLKSLNNVPAPDIHWLSSGFCSNRIKFGILRTRIDKTIVRRKNVSE